MRILILAVLLVLNNVAESHPQPQAAQIQNTPKKEQQGTKAHPIFVEIVPAHNADKKSAEQENHSQEKADEDKRLTYATVWLAAVTTFLTIFTGGLWLATYRLARDSKKTGERQAAEMRASIAEATRAASAMEDIAEATKKNALLMQEILSKQMRAYLSVVIGGATYQERDKNLKFEAKPMIKNHRTYSSP